MVRPNSTEGPRQRLDRREETDDSHAERLRHGLRLCIEDINDAIGPVGGEHLCRDFAMLGVRRFHDRPAGCRIGRVAYIAVRGDAVAVYVLDLRPEVFCVVAYDRPNGVCRHDPVAPVHVRDAQARDLGIWGRE